MTTATLNTTFAAPRAVARPAAKVAAPSIWTLLSQSLEMARIVGEYGPVSGRQLRQVRIIAGQL